MILWDNNEENNQATHDEIKSMGYSRVHAFRVDVTDEREMRLTANKVRNEIGNVDVVVMAAAPTFKPRSILETNYAEDIEKHFKIGYIAQLWIIQEFLKSMIERNHGKHFFFSQINLD